MIIKIMLIPLLYNYVGGNKMKELRCTTSIFGETEFSISISENLGWIAPVFLFISPNLKKFLRVEEEPSYLSSFNHFEVLKLNDNCYELHFLNSNDKIKGDTLEFKIERAQYIGKELKDSETYSLFNCSYQFKETCRYQEYCFFFVANNISYLTSFSAFSVENY